MSKDKTTDADTTAIDRYELGEVETVKDLEPDSQVGPSRKAHEQQRTLKSSSNGYFELEGGSKGGLGEPLHLGEEFKLDGGSRVTQYESAYNIYSIPLRSAYRSLGRVKDVSITGAAMTPAELMKRPELAARFKRLMPGQSNVQNDLAYNMWSNSQTQLKLNVQRFGAGQHEMSAALADYRRVQAMLNERRTKARLAEKTHEFDELNATAETLARIVETSAKAWAAAGEIEEAIEAKTVLNEAAEGPVIDPSLPSGTTPDWQHGTSRNPNPALDLMKQTAAQRAGGAAQAAYETSATQHRIGAFVKKHLETAGKLEISLKDVFIVATGNAEEYGRLQKDIALLNGKIQSLQLDQEGELVRSASERLTGFSMEYGVRRDEVRSGRVEARQGAATYADSVGGGPQMVDTMYAAEAYQELAAFGGLAQQQRQAMVDPVWGGAHAYVHSYDKARFVALGTTSDAFALATNLQDVQDQHRYFSKYVPEWQQVAKQWSEFLGDHATTDLVKGPTKADKTSGAP